MLGVVKLIANPDLDKYNYYKYFLLSDGSGFGKNVTIFGADWVHLCMFIIEKKILILGKSSTQRLNDTTLTSGSEYPIDFSKQQ